MEHQIIQKIQKITIQGHGGTDWTQSMLQSAQAGHFLWHGWHVGHWGEACHQVVQ